MKNIISIILTVLFVVSTIALCVYGSHIRMNETYTTFATAINENEVVTDDGNIWAVEDTLEEKGIYKVTFKVNRVRDPYDDEILAIEFVKMDKE